MKRAAIFAVVAICPILSCLAQTNTTSRQSINLNATQVGNPTAVATSLGATPGLPVFPRAFPVIIGPLHRNDQRRGLGIGQEGFGTTIGQQGTTLVEPVVVPDFGLTPSPGTRFAIGPQGFATSLGQFGPMFGGGRNLGLIGPQTAPNAVGSQIVALAINAQNSSITIGPQGVGNTVAGQRLTPLAQLQQTRTFTVPGIPHTAFAGRTAAVVVRGR